MFYATFLVLWLELDVGSPPAAAFIQPFDTYKACQEYRDRIVDDATKKRTACMMLVVEPKEGIKE